MTILKSTLYTSLGGYNSFDFFSQKQIKQNEVSS